MFKRPLLSLLDPEITRPSVWLPAFDADDQSGVGSGGDVSEESDGDTDGNESSEVRLGPHGYPLNTKPAAMSSEHQAAFYRHKMRQAQDTNKLNQQRIAELEPVAGQFRALEEASKSEADRAIEQARREARDTAVAETEAAARAKYGSVLVGAEFRVQLAGKLTAEQVSTLVGGLDVTRFLTEEGQPDTDRIGEYVAALPAAQPQPAPAPPGRVNLGQGARPGAVVSGLAQGADLYAQRHQKRNATA